MPIRTLAAAAAMLALPVAAPAAVFEFDILAADEILGRLGLPVDRLMGAAEIRLADEVVARGGWTTLDDASFAFTLFGQSFDGGDDVHGGPDLKITDGVPSWIRFGVTEREGGRVGAIDHPWFLEADVYGGLTPGPDGRLAIVAGPEPHERHLQGPAPIPLPAGLPLAVGALAVLIGLRRCRARPPRQPQQAVSGAGPQQPASRGRQAGRSASSVARISPPPAATAPSR